MGDTHLFVHAKRGRKAMESPSLVIADFHGWAIHDRLGSYFGFEDVRHGSCNAHILRDLQGVIETGSAWAQEMKEFLIELYVQGKVLEGEEAERVRERYREILSQAEQEEPPPKKPPGGKGRAKSSPGRIFCEAYAHMKKPCWPLRSWKGYRLPTIRRSGICVRQKSNRKSAAVSARNTERSSMLAWRR